MLRRLWAEEAGRPERRELQLSRRDRMSEVTSFTAASVERYFPTKLMKFSMDSVLSRRMARVLTVREWDCGILS